MSPNPPQEGLHEHIETIAENAERDITDSRRTQDHLRHVGGILLIIYAIQLSLFGLLAGLVHAYPVNQSILRSHANFRRILRPG